MMNQSPAFGFLISMRALRLPVAIGALVVAFRSWRSAEAGEEIGVAGAAFGEDAQVLLIGGDGDLEHLGAAGDAAAVEEGLAVGECGDVAGGLDDVIGGDFRALMVVHAEGGDAEMRGGGELERGGVERGGGGDGGVVRGVADGWRR